MNIAEIYEQHYYPAQTKKCRANTMEGYDSSVRLHVLPRWGACEIEEIDPDELEAWCDSFERRGAAKKAYKCLRQIIRWAIAKLRLRVFDPTRCVEEPKTPHYRPKVLEADELVAMQRGFWGHELEALVLIDTSLGARRGEACAVNPKRDIDWKTGAVRLGPSAQVVKGRRMLFGPKTERSDRVVYLPKYVLRRLRQIARNMTDVTCGLTPDQAARRIKSWCKKRGLPHVSMTNNRHTWATVAIESGASIERVSMILGHTDIGTAYDHYIVLRKTVCQEVQEGFERYVFKHAPKLEPMQGVA